MQENEREKYYRLRNEYYSKVYILWELVKGLKDKELGILASKQSGKHLAIRYILCFSLDYWEKHNKRFGIVYDDFNLYCSIATFNKHVPVFSYNMQERKQDPAYINFNENFLNYVKSFDLFLDFDGKDNPKQAYENCAVVKTLFDEYKLPYFIHNSSLTGFHLIIPSNYMPNIEPMTLLIKFNEIVLNLKKIYMLDALDTGVQDIKRLRKISYGLVGDGAVVLPLSDLQFNNFKTEMVTIENVLNNTHLKERGLLIRTWNLSEEQLKLNVIKFIKDFQ